MNTPYPTVLVKKLLEQYMEDPVVIRIPEKRPERFIRIDCSDPILYEVGVARQCLIIVQAYGPSDSACLGLLEQAEACLGEYLDFEETSLGWIQHTSPTRADDPDRPTVRRWQFTGTFYQSITS